jgi:hypothetical protein
MADYLHGRDADPHLNGTIWAASLWELRTQLKACAPNGIDGARLTDLIVLKALLRIGEITCEDRPSTCRTRSHFRTGLSALIQAEHEISGGKWRDKIVACFVARGIHPRGVVEVGQ